MSSYLWVALGSALGGVARYWCSVTIERLAGHGFPWGTLAVNVLGSGLIGVLAALAVLGGDRGPAPGLRLLLITGFCGGYTTFSAFSLQTLALLEEGRPAAAAVNITASVAGCVIATWAGYRLALLAGPPGG